MEDRLLTAELVEEMQNVVAMGVPVKPVLEGLCKATLAGLVHPDRHQHRDVLDLPAPAALRRPAGR